MKGRRLFLVAVAAAFLGPPIPGFAQSTPADSYVPYEDDEFPQWMHDLRRAEVVFIGSFPITLLLASLSYEAFRATRDSIARTPLVDRAEFGSFSSAERTGLLVSGLSLSGLVTIADLIIEIAGRRRGDEAER